MGVAIFATQNMELVEIKFISLTSIPMPLGLALVSSAGLGAVAMTLWQSQADPPKRKSPQSSPKDTSRATSKKTRTVYDEDDFDDPVEDDWD